MSTGTEFEEARLGKTSAERAASAVLPVSAVAWTAAEVMHWAGVHAAEGTGMVTAFATAVAWGAAGRGRVPASLPWWIAVAGGWLAAADAFGPLAWWPAPVLSAAWLVIAVKAHRAAHRHEAVASAREWRASRIDWLERRHRWHLPGSHLLDYQETRLGELYEISTKGTGKRASHFVGRALEETIAEAEDLAVTRVRVMEHRLAGRIRISIRRLDPWADPILHPLVCDEHEIGLPEYRSILDPAPVGQDPETGELLTVPLYGETGANRVSITANSGGGKGVLEDMLLEHVTACDDAIAVHLNLSFKGHEDEECWGPACHLTAYGPERKARAAQVLKVVAAILEWRTKNFRRGQYVPSPEHPAIIIFNDESDAALGALREDINTVVTKGRSHGAGMVRLGQRNTREYIDPKARSQDNVRCTGLVQNENEARHAGSGTGPDMSTYGEGKPGVWKIEVLGGAQQVGRTWVFSPSPAAHGEEVERIARDRAFGQPEISGACREYLGAPYEALLASEVFARWARQQNPGAYEAGADDDGETAGITAPHTEPAAAVTEPEAAPDAAVATPAGKTALAERDPFERWLEMDVDEGTRARIEAVHAKLNGARQMLEETAAMPRTAGEVSPEALAAHAAERWQQVGEAAEIPDDARPRLLEMLGEGTTISAVATEFGIKRWTARTWLEALRNDGAAFVDGERRGARWRLAAPPGDGNAE